VAAKNKTGYKRRTLSYEYHVLCGKYIR